MGCLVLVRFCLRPFACVFFYYAAMMPLYLPSLPWEGGVTPGPGMTLLCLPCAGGGPFPKEGGGRKEFSWDLPTCKFCPHHLLWDHATLFWVGFLPTLFWFPPPLGCTRSPSPFYTPTLFEPPYHLPHATVPVPFLPFYLLPAPSG